MHNMLKVLFAVVATLVFAAPTQAQTQVAAEQQAAPTAVSSLDIVRGRKYTGNYTTNGKSMGLELTVATVNGKDGSGRITFFPRARSDLTCRGEHDATLHLQDDGRLQISFHRPICDDVVENGVKIAKIHVYNFTIKDGGKTLLSDRGGELTN